MHNDRSARSMQTERQRESAAREMRRNRFSAADSIWVLMRMPYNVDIAAVTPKALDFN